jgi:autotransporter-associated beta strand protein
MKNKTIIFLFVAISWTLGLKAQRPMDVLDRGLVAVKTSGGVFCSWRIPGEEWYDVTYNIYRDGIKLNAKPLNVSNYTDIGGSLTSKYTVRSVVRGVEQGDCTAASVWDNQYLSIPMSDVYIPMVGTKQHKVNSLFELNDASVADIDGDGQYEVIVKRVNGDFTVANDSVFTRFEAYKLNGTKLWQIDCGPNMVSGNNVEVNLVAYDWDCDGKAECVMRCADGTTLNDGTVIGDASKNYRPYISQTGNMTYMTQGNEYLILLDGKTGKLLDKIDYPLPRGNVSDWGDKYGHRANKFFFGAPFLDGRKPSLVLCRGIYTKTIMCAYDVVGKKFSKRWENLTDFTTEGSDWFGQGYHNFGIADVDDDGKDEIVYGSMVVDDNGKGLYTTGLGHGDAQHCGDFDPYHKGLEIFACLEDNPGADYRDAATGKILWRYTTGSDCGRCMAANVSNDYDGAALMAGPHLISATTQEEMAQKGGVTQNFELYWDGDLLQETFDYTSGNEVVSKGYGTPAIYKYGSNTPIFTMDGTATNNYTKGTPSMQCDIFGDWREEVIARSTDNMSLRIYTTTAPTENRVYTLLHDMQYRNAIEWQMCGYNQPPHESFFLGEREGILVPPPPVTINGRTEETSSITSSDNDKHVILCNMNGGNVTVSSGAQPYILTVNSPKDYTLTGAALTGSMRLIKQGEGNLTLSGTDTYTGETNIWDGTLTFNGTMTASRVWMNRFAEFNLTGSIDKSLTEEYGAVTHIAGKNVYWTASVDTLTLKKGAAVEFDVLGDGSSFESNDKLNVDNLVIKDGAIFQFVQHDLSGASKPVAGKYLLGTYKNLDANVNNIKVEGLGGTGAKVELTGGKIYVNVPDTRTANADLTWSGAESSVWNTADAKNFNNDGSNDVFILGDKVIFDDNASNTSVAIKGAVSPSSVTFNNDKNNYTISGDSIIGKTSFTKNGKGSVTLNNINRYIGGTNINAGTVVVSSLANSDGVDNGALGNISSPININGGATLSIAKEGTMSQTINIGTGGGATLNIPTGTVLMKNASILGSGDVIKTGNGQFSLYSGNKIKRLYVNEGTVYDEADAVSVGDTVVFNGTKGVMKFNNSIYTYSSCSSVFKVPENKIGTLYLDGRCTYTGKLVGEGTLNVHATWVRTWLNGDWSGFAGTINAYQDGVVAKATPSFNFTNSYGLSNATLNIQSGCTFLNTDPQTASSYKDNLKIGALEGAGTLSGKGSYIVGTKDVNFGFSGTIEDGINVTKTGSGVWTMSSLQPNMGTMTVDGGELQLRSTSTTSTSTGVSVMNVNSGGTLSGFAYCGNSAVNLKANSTLSPGTPAKRITNSTLIFSGDVNAESGSNAKFNIFSTSRYGNISVDGTLKLNGNVVVTLDEGYVAAVGDEFTLWKSATFTGTPKLILPQLPAGLDWDTSALLANTGILKVVSSTGINGIYDDENVTCTVYALNGATVGKFYCQARDINAKIKQMTTKRGTYMVVIKSDHASVTKKITF